jgi:hypothetical protein
MESQFYGSLQADHIEGKWWRLSAPLAFYSERYDITICAPAGLVTDFASVPRLPMAYMFAGGTGHWEAVIHDLMYRFGRPCRSSADQIFFESGRVRSGMRHRQGWVYRAGRWLRSSLMTGAVSLLGGINYEPVPGCLDYRHKDRCGRECKGCRRFYPDWKGCVCPGCDPGVLERHRRAA